MRKMMVLGGSGFIGHHLIRRRAAEGSWKIVSVDIKPPRERINNVEYVNHDVRELTTLQGHADTSLIYNFAAVHTTPGHPFWEYYDTNVGGAIATTAFARLHGVSKIIFTSSISVYGPSEEQKDEDSPPDPNSAYGWSKLLAEDIFRSWYNSSQGAQLLIVRPAVVFGEGEGGNFTRLAQLLAKGIFVYPGRRDTVKACIYVKDLLDYIDVMLGKNEPFILFNGCYAERYELQQVVAELRRYFPRSREFVFPSWAVMAAAKAMKALPNSIGIHPERILKLIRSTNIIPKVLIDENLVKYDSLKPALKDWCESTDGAFL